MERLTCHLRAYYRNRFSRIGHGPAEAEDLLQEALNAIHTHRHTYDRLQPFTPWIHAVARYKFLDYLRRTKSSLRNYPIEKADELIVDREMGAVESGLDLQRLLSEILLVQSAFLRIVLLGSSDLMGFRSDSEKCWYQLWLTNLLKSPLSVLQTPLLSFRLHTSYLDRSMPSANSVSREIQAGGVRRVAFDASGLTSWDSSLITFLVAVADLCRARSIELDPSALPPGAKKLLALTESVPERGGHIGSGPSPEYLHPLE